MSEKEQNLIKLADKKGNDADLLLLDEIQRVDDKVIDVEKRVSELESSVDIPQDTKIDNIASRLAVKLAVLEKGEIGAQGERGEPGQTPTEEELLALITPLIPKPIPGKNGKDGKTPTKAELRDLIEPLIPESIPGTPGRDGKDGKDASFDLSLIEQLQEEIKLLKEEIVAVKKRPTRLGMKKITSVRYIDLTASVDGIATTFTLPMDTLKVLAVESTQFPITFRSGTDFSFAGRTLTINSTIEAGQTLGALIECAFYA